MKGRKQTKMKTIHLIMPLNYETVFTHKGNGKENNKGYKLTREYLDYVLVSMLQAQARVVGVAEKIEIYLLIF